MVIGSALRTYARQETCANSGLLKTRCCKKTTHARRLTFFFLCQRQGEVLPGHLGKGVALLTGTVLNPMQKNQRHTHGFYLGT